MVNEVNHMNTRSFDGSTSRNSSRITKSTVLDEVLRFFVNENIPLHKVESPHLKRLLLGAYLIRINVNLKFQFVFIAIFATYLNCSFYFKTVCCGKNAFPEGTDRKIPQSNARTSTFKEKLFNHQTATSRIEVSILIIDTHTHTNTLPVCFVFRLIQNSI